MSSLNTLPVLQSIRWVMAKRKMQLRHSKKSDDARTNSDINPACFTWLAKNPNQSLRRVSLLKGCLVDAPEQRADLTRTPETQVIQRCQREDAGKETSPDTLLEPKMRASRSNWCLCYVIASFGNHVSLEIAFVEKCDNSLKLLDTFRSAEATSAHLKAIGGNHHMQHSIRKCQFLK